MPVPVLLRAVQGVRLTMLAASPVSRVIQTARVVRTVRAVQASRACRLKVNRSNRVAQIVRAVQASRACWVNQANRAAGPVAARQKAHPVSQAMMVMLVRVLNLLPVPHPAWAVRPAQKPVDCPVVCRVYPVRCRAYQECHQALDRSQWMVCPPGPVLVYLPDLLLPLPRHLFCRVGRLAARWHQPVCPDWPFLRRSGWRLPVGPSLSVYPAPNRIHCWQAQGDP